MYAFTNVYVYVFCPLMFYSSLEPIRVQFYLIFFLLLLIFLKNYKLK